jgi:hypothetical protein
MRWLMSSVVPTGTTDRMIARTFWSALRAGPGTPARYSSTLRGAEFGFAVERRARAGNFFMAR